MRIRALVVSVLLLIVISIAISGNAGPQISPVALKEEPGSYQISVNVHLVVLSVTVHDRQGHLVTDLKENNFEVYEDGVRQTISFFQHEDLPVTVGVVVDHSGSMKTKLADVISAARTFVVSSNPADEMFVVNFNERVTLGLPAAMAFTNKSDELERAISKTAAAGMTALYDAIGKALEGLQAGTRDKKVLIVISDGGDNASKQTLAGVLKMAGQSSAAVYTIGIYDEADPDSNPGVLKRLARETGGEAFFPRGSDTVIAVCGRIAKDIRNQYTIGYSSTKAVQSGAYRTVKVVAKHASHGKLSVRARAGYFVSEGVR